MSTLYAAFSNPHDAEKAIGGLLDNGAKQEDLSLIASHSSAGNEAQTEQAEASGKSGISTTTGTDALVGGVKGTAIGFGVGMAALAAALFVPGVGLVLGGGALASALAGLAGTAAAGAAAGTVTGYLVDQGLDADVATVYSSALASGGAMLAVSVPTGKLDDLEAEKILTKYGATNIATYNSMKGAANVPMTQSAVPLEVERTNMDPVVLVEHAAVVQSPVVTRQITTTTDTVTGEVRETETISRQGSPEVKTYIDADTGVATQVSVQPTPVVVQNERVVQAPVVSTVFDPLTQTERQVITQPVAVLETGMVIDPVTGEAVVRLEHPVLDPVTGLPVYEPVKLI